MTRLPLSPFALSTVAAYTEEDWSTDAPDIEAVCRAYRAGGGASLLVAPSDVEAVARGLVTLANTEDETCEGRHRSPDPETRRHSRAARDGLSAAHGRLLRLAA